MNMNQNGNNSTYSLYLAVAAIIMSVVTIAAFFLTNGGTLFFISGGVAIIMGLYLSYRISTEDKMLARRKPKR